MTRFAQRYINRARARAEYGAQADAYAAFQLRSDVLGDAAADELAVPGGFAHLQAVLEGAVPGPALAAVLDESHTVPAWVDFDRMLPGARLQQRLGPMGMLILGAWSLMNSYHCGPAVKPLSFTGQLTRRADRRLAETSRYVVAATQDDALRPGHAGWEMSIRVRLMHAAVRRMIRRAGGFDEAAWGAPINQADMVGTLIEFSIFIIWGARRLGFAVSDAEADGLVHLWRYAGHLNGVRPDLLAHFETVEGLERFAHLVHLIQPGPDGDSLALADALRQSLLKPEAPWRERLAAQTILKVHDGLSWTLNVEPIAADLGIPNRRWRHVFTAARPMIRAVEAARVRVPRLHALAVRNGGRQVEVELQRMLKGVEPRFEAARAPA